MLVGWLNSVVGPVFGSLEGEKDDSPARGALRGGRVEKVELSWLAWLKKLTHPELPPRGVLKKSRGVVAWSESR